MFEREAIKLKGEREGVLDEVHTHTHTHSNTHTHTHTHTHTQARTHARTHTLHKSTSVIIVRQGAMKMKREGGGGVERDWYRGETGRYLETLRGRRE